MASAKAKGAKASKGKTAKFSFNTSLSLVADLENNAVVREIHRLHKRFVLDWKLGAADRPIKATMRNLKHNKALLGVYLYRMVITEGKKVFTIPEIGHVNDTFHSKWNAELDGIESYTENWNVKRMLNKVRTLWVKFLKRPVMDSST